MKDQTISEALGISNNESAKIYSDIREVFDKTETHDEAIKIIIEKVKNDAFGEHDSPISDYEFKLFYAAMKYGNIMMVEQVKMNMLKNFFNPNENE